MPTPTAQTLRSVPGPGPTQDLVASSVVALADIIGLTHGELARKASLHPSTLSRALRQGRRLSVDEVDAIAAALNVPRSTLYIGGQEIRRRACRAVTGPTPGGPGGQEESPTIWKKDRQAQVLRFPSQAA